MNIHRKRKISPELLQYFNEVLPDVVTRAQIEELTNGLIKKCVLEKQGSLGGGPKALSFGAKVVYRKQDLMDWITTYYGGGDDDGDNNGTGGEIRTGETGADGAGEAGGRD